LNNTERNYLTPILNGHSISISSIDATPAPFTVLTELLLPFGFNFVTIQTIYNNRFQASGANYYSPTFLLQKDRQDWILTPIGQIADFEFTVFPESTLTVPTGTIHFQTISIESFKGFSNAQNIAYIDADKLEWPLTIRNWQDGDKFYPFGMQGMKKVSDFLIDLKVPVSQKKRISILTNKGEILWIVGFRTDKMYKITDSTKKILIATFTPLIQELDNII
jgi:tRNA(Ile)-lysidine synthetase, C-terminal domain